MLYRFEDREPTVDPLAYVSESAQVIGDVVVGPQCYVGHGVILRGDYGRIEIGTGTAIEEGVIGHAPPGDTFCIGDHVTVGHGAVIHGALIDDWAVVGMGAILSLRSQVGRWSIVAEGAVVRMLQEVADGMVVAGNPAETVRETAEKDRALWEFGKQLYVDLAARYLAGGLEPLDR